MTLSSAPSFLALPPKIRLQIYVFCGLVRCCPISVNKEAGRKAYREERLESYYNDYHTGEYGDTQFASEIYCDYMEKKYLMGSYFGGTSDNECICPPLPIHLLTVCRAIHQEASDILYSRNKFKILLERNITLNPASIARMTSLCIRLNLCSCIPNHFCQHPPNGERCRVCHALCRRGRDPALSISSDKWDDVIRKWTEVCRILQTAIRPEMRLSIICDCEDLATARKIVEPLKLLPKASECSIRLGQSPAAEWRQVAEDTALRLTGRPLTTTFRFQDLPKELQRDILYHTDLVSPYILRCESPGIMPFEKGDRTCCFQCTDAGEVCCCVINHAAFSTVQCKCWRFPAALFGVSRDMKHEATAIFFSRNRFLISEDPWPRSGIPGMRSTLSLLQSLPPQALKYLRWIRVNLFRHDRLNVVEGSPPFHSWKETARFIERNLDTSMLTIELDFLYNHELPDSFELEDASTRENNWESYQRMAEVFFFKDGLNDFFVHLASPYDLSQDGQVDASPVRRERESVLEKRIMGESYESRDRGKYTNRGVSLSDEVYRQRYGTLPDRLSF